MSRFRYLLCLAAGLVVYGLGCSCPTGSTNDAGPDGSSDAGPGDAGTQTNCVLPPLITKNMELTTVCNPWILTSQGTSVEGSDTGTGPVLTVDPGVNIAAQPGAFLEVGPPLSG